MTYEDILTTVYFAEFQLGQFSMAYDSEGTFFLSSWTVPGVPEPTNEEILALETPEVLHLFNCNQFFAAFYPVLNNYFSTVAKQRNYLNELSCISYYHSTNTQWQSESQTFSAWRDDVWTYVLQQRQDILDEIREIPVSNQVLIEELPVITWP
jgi:hypothetical protein